MLLPPGAAIRLARIALSLAVALLAVACGGEQPIEKPEGAREPASMSTPAGEAGLGPPRADEPAAPAPAPRPGTRTIAVINGDPVTREDLDLEVEALMRRNFGTDAPAGLLQQHRAMIEKSAFDQLVLKAQLRAYADANRLAVAESDVDQQMADILQRFGSPEQADTVLKHAGLTTEELREDVRQGVLMDKAVDHYLGSIPEPATAEVAAYFGEHLDRYVQPEEVVASHILIAATPEEDAASREAKRARIEAIRGELLAGAEFAGLAKQHSDCPSAQRGGELGAFTRGRMAPEFEQAAFSLEPGVISEPVETKFGFHLIRVAEHTPSATPELDVVRPQVVKEMQREDLTAWFKDLIQDATVERL